MVEEKLKEQLKELLDKHTKGLLSNDDFNKALGEKVAEILKDSQGDMDQLKKNIETMSKEIKTLRTGTLADNSAKILDPLYDGCWKSAELARDFGLYVLASVCDSQKALDLLKAKGYDLQKDMSHSDNASGSLLAPTQLLDGIVMLVSQYGKFRQNALVVPMSSDSATGIKLVSGLSVYCVSEGVAPTKSDPAFQPLGLNAKEWSTYVAIDRSLDEDAAIAIGNLVGELIAMAFAQKEDEVGFLGDGTEPYFNHVGVIGQFKKMVAASVTPKGLITGGGTAWSGYTLDHFEQMQARVHDGVNEDNLKWYCSRRFYYEVMRHAALDKSTNAEEIISNRVTKKKTFLGDDVEFVAAMPKETGVGQYDCIYGDLKRGANLGDRRSMTIEQSREALFLERQIAILGTERVAFNVYGCGDGNNAGTLVALKTADS